MERPKNDFILYAGNGIYDAQNEVCGQTSRKLWSIWFPSYGNRLCATRRNGRNDSGTGSIYGAETSGRSGSGTASDARFPKA